MTRTRLAWLALLAVVAGTMMMVFLAGSDEPTSPAKQADAIAQGVRCPTCSGQSVAESMAPGAQAIKSEIRRRIDDGQTRAEIEAYLEDRYGSDILLTPPGSGIGGVVWVLPVVAVVGAAAGLTLALRRWSGRVLAHPTDADRAIVDRLR